MILYQRWLQVLDRHAGATAIVDHEKQSRLTFSQINETLSRMPVASAPIVANGVGLPFILETLRAWRDGQVLIPQERAEPTAIQKEALISGTVHVKTTSGSTGERKHILFTGEQLAADADQIVETMGLATSSPNVGVISLAHSYGFSNLVLPLLLHGIPLHLGANPLPESIRGVLDRVEEATLPAVPVMWKTWHRSGVLESHGARIRLAISAGAPLKQELETACFETTGLKIHNFYGSSECGGIAFDSSEKPRQHPGEIGRPMRGVTVQVTSQGLLEVTSPAVALGSSPADPASFPRPGVLRLTDEGEIIDGIVCLRGRRGDAINIAGRKIAPASIETVIENIEGVRHCLVFSIPSTNAERVEEIVATLSLVEGASLTSIQAEARKRLPNNERPKHWWPCADLKPDSRGKFSRFSWRKGYLERSGDG